MLLKTYLNQQWTRAPLLALRLSLYYNLRGTCVVFALPPCTGGSASGGSLQMKFFLFKARFRLRYLIEGALWPWDRISNFEGVCYGNIFQCMALRNYFISFCYGCCLVRESFSFVNFVNVLVYFYLHSWFDYRSYTL